MDLADHWLECVESLASLPEDDEEHDFSQSRIFPTVTNASPHASYDRESSARVGIDIEQAFLGVRMHGTRSSAQQTQRRRLSTSKKFRHKSFFTGRSAQRWDAIRALEQLLAEDDGAEP